MRALDIGGAAVGSHTAGAQDTIRFAKDFEVDVRALELRRLGRSVKLERIPVQVLLILVENKGRLVTREEIAEKIWGKGVFLDTDNGINGAIRKIRQVLRDDPQQPRFVQTIQGRGYRFIASVSEDEVPSAALPPDQFPSVVEDDRDKSQTRPSSEMRHDALGSGPAPKRKHLIPVAAAVICFSIIALIIWAWRQHLSGTRSAQSIRSIAVLPLQNLSADPAQEYFADGMTEELITELSRIQSLRVVSHTSVTGYKNTKKRLPEIARELGVDGILEGSVIRENNDVRVTVQLLDGPNDRHIWSEAYERPLHGVLNLQRDLAEAVTREIQIKLTPQQQARIVSTRSVDPAAYEAYLRGRYAFENQFSMAGPLLQAKNYFEEAIRKDPTFAQAYAGLADAYLYLAIFRYAPQDEAFLSAKEALGKAMKLDDSIGEAHDTLGVISWRHDWDWALTQRELDRATSLAPSYSCAHEDRAQFLALLGRRAEALSEVEKSKKLDLGPSANMTEAGVYYQLRDYPALVQTARLGIASNPNEWLVHYDLAIGLEGIGRLAEAITEYQKALELSNGDQDVSASLAHAYAASGKREKAETILHDLERRSKDGNVSPYLLAATYAGLGDKNKAIEFLETAYRQRSLELSWHLKADPRIDSLRSDPRFQEIERQVGIPK